MHVIREHENKYDSGELSGECVGERERPMGRFVTEVNAE